MLLQRFASCTAGATGLGQQLGCAAAAAAGRCASTLVGSSNAGGGTGAATATAEQLSPAASTSSSTSAVAGAAAGKRGAASTACDLQTKDHLVKGGGAAPVIVVRAPMRLEKRIGFIGAGQMAEALTRGLVDRELIDVTQVSCSDPSPHRKELFRSMGASSYECNIDVARSSDVLVVAVKPEHVSVVLHQVRPVLRDSHTVVSIAAGVTLTSLTEAAGPEARVVRVMPNTPCLVGETAAAMCLGGRADASDERLVRQLFEAVGRIYTVDEKLLSAVTGLSGSGPAYVFMVIEALADGGVRAGLPRDIAQALAAQTVLGSAKMVIQTGKHPGALKDMVTSPGGTTIAGVHELEKRSMRAAFMDAVLAATNRADELSKIAAS